MPTAELLTQTESQRPRQRLDADAVLNALEQFCGRMQPGDLVPPHQELMRQFDASERAVRWALDELRRQGRIIRRQGAGTFIAENGPVSNGVSTGNGHAPAAATAVNSRTVVAIGTPDHALFDLAMKQLFRQAEDAELSMICRFVDPKSGALPALPTAPEGQLGFVLFRRDLLPLAKQLQNAGHRVVMIGAPFIDETFDVPSIYGDHEQGGYLATQHLIELGHERIAFCSAGDPTRGFRWQGHQRAIREARRKGKNIQDTALDLAEINAWKEDLAGGEALFRSPEAPTGLAIWNDHEAVSVLSVLSRLGLRVPEDVSIVGYDNLPEGQMFHPALTTVYSPIEQQLQAALNLLTRPTPAPSNYQMVVLPTLIRRDSSAPLAV